MDWDWGNEPWFPDPIMLDIPFEQFIYEYPAPLDLTWFN